jgi:DNA-binding NarL/FixJ family response regulator
MEADRLLKEEVAIGAGAAKRLGVLIAAEVRFVRDALAEILVRDSGLSLSGVSADLKQALKMTLDLQPDVVVLDAAFPDGIDVVRQIRSIAPGVRVVVLAVAETEENIIAWAEAGVTGYIPRIAALVDIVTVLRDIVGGEQTCSRRVAAGLLHRIATAANSGKPSSEPTSAPMLTAREMQIVQLVGAGLSNKDIARRLNIGLATTKSHVHNMLEKLELQRRGQVALWIRRHESHLEELLRWTPFVRQSEPLVKV